MDPKYFKFHIDERGVAYISLNRPEIHNAFNDEFINELNLCFKSLDLNEDINLVVIQGEGKSFCAGADLNWMKKMVDYGHEENYEDSRRLSTLFQNINHCRFPVLGIIQGAALGGGSGLVACCDYALASEKAVFGFTEVRLGLVPAVISPFVISKIGESHARALFLSGTKFSAEEAHRIGLVHGVCKEEEFQEKKESLIKSFLKAGPVARMKAKSLIQNVIELTHKGDILEVTDYTCHIISELRVSKEGQEGMSSLLEKRPSKWS